MGSWCRTLYVVALLFNCSEWGHANQAATASPKNFVGNWVEAFEVVAPTSRNIIQIEPTGGDSAPSVSVAGFKVFDVGIQKGTLSFKVQQWGIDRVYLYQVSPTSRDQLTAVVHQVFDGVANSGVFLSGPLKRIPPGVPLDSVLPKRAQSAAGGIRAEIEAAERGGATSPLPKGAPCRRIASNVGGSASYRVKNSTAYTLRLLLTGSVDKELVVSSNSTGSLDLPGGSYKIMATVSSPGVRPFLGTESFPDSAECVVEFFISATP